MFPEHSANYSKRKEGNQTDRNDNSSEKPRPRTPITNMRKTLTNRLPFEFSNHYFFDYIEYQQ